MPQKTNLNVSPYFDDFDPNDGYHKVLFKPGYPVQARELTTLQSILQNQIEQFGTHVFKEGSSVVGGEISYRNDLNAVLLENNFDGFDVSVFFSTIASRKIRGKISGVTAIVNSFFDSNLSDLGQSTIYVKYLDSDKSSNTISKFFDGEELEILQDSSYDQFINNTLTTVSLQSGQSFARTTSSNCNRTGSAIFLKAGIWFLRGFFVNVPEQVLYLDQYSSTSNCKVGLKVSEQFINSYEDESLNDNSNGFSNYAAPGADRFKIEAFLTKIPLSSETEENFIQIKEIRNGIDLTFANTTEYNVLSQEFAKRTFDESGDYYVSAPNITVKETLNDLKGNNGVFNKDQLTYNNNIPSDDLGTYSISPINAYVRGYNVGNSSTLFLDFKKPRTTKTLQNQSINYYTGSTYTLNRVYGSPVVSISTSYTLSLRDSRVGSSQTTPPGNEIGLARVYDFALESGSYSTSNKNLNEWDITLYDLQTYTNIHVNEPITLSIPTHIKGKSSGAVAYLRYETSNAGVLTAYNINGKFSIGETLIFNGIDGARISTAIESYGESDVKSLYGIVGSGFTFTADTKLYSSNNIGFVNISASSGGISTVIGNNVIFTGIATVGNIVAFTNPGISTISYAKINSVSQNSLTISNVESVTGICYGDLPASAITPSDFRILSSRLQTSTDNTLYTKLPKERIASVDLTDSYLTIKKQFDVTITSNSTGPITTNSENETFLPFDEERYTLVRKDGYTEELTSDKFSFTNGSRTLVINGLNSNGPAKLITTIRKIKIKEKIKNRNKVKTLIIDKSMYVGSGVGATTLNDGLIYGKYPYGTRVQDEEICLLEPDVTKIHGIYESNDVSNPNLPSLTLFSLDGPTNKTGDLILGEEFIGESSNSIAIYSEKINDLKISVVNLNGGQFIEGESVLFKESGIRAIISGVDSGDINITSNFIFESGQKNSIYDYSKIVRKNTAKEPVRKIKIVYESASFSSSDVGDIITVNSYNQFDYCDVGFVNNIKNTDILDIRPRVSNASISEYSRSPFEFLFRSFIQPENNATNVLASDESILINYSFYLPRIDKIFLTKNGVFQLSPGEPAETPQFPNKIDDALELATIVLPPYLCDMSEVSINLTDHKRYKMSDIKNLEDRIRNLEYYTALSLLEIDTSNLLIRDSNGLNRFKSGFFVDDFSSTISQKKVTEIKNSIDIGNSELRPAPYTTQIDLLLGTQSLIGIGVTADPLVDSKYATDLIGSNIKKTGQVLTLNYEEVEEIVQPYATFVVNVNPYSNAYYGGTISLFPSSDTWVDQVRMSPKTIVAEGNYTETSRQLTARGFDAQSGFGPITWNSWETVWTGTNTSTNTKEVTEGYKVYSKNIEVTTKTGTSTRTGTRQALKEKLDSTSFGDQIIRSSIIPFMRSRNIEFTAKRLKPSTRVYAFFDGVNVNNYIIPKLLEVNVTNGVFQVGETVTGSFDNLNSNFARISFRVAKQNHKYGPYNNPTDVYTTNPYDINKNLSENYSSTSTILNVDTYSLSNQPQGQFFGYIASGMKLRGNTSGAEAVITDVRLITDNIGTLIGSFYVPNPNVDLNPSFECGTKIFRLTSNSENSQIEGVSITGAEEKYFSEGKVNTVQENIIVIRNSRVETQNQTESRIETSVGPEVVLSSTLIRDNTPAPSYSAPSASSAPSPPKTVVEISGAVNAGNYSAFSGKTLGGITFNSNGTVSNAVQVAGGQYVYSPGASTTWGTPTAGGGWVNQGAAKQAVTTPFFNQVAVYKK